MSFDLAALVSDCQAALSSEKPYETVAGIVRKLVSDPAAVKAGLEIEDVAGIGRLYVSHELTIINVVWAPKMTLPAHNHNTWAVIGVYEGREDNIFWRRQEGMPNGEIKAAGARSIAAGEAVYLGENLIHSVTNPTATFTRAIHVYGGNFFEIARSEWDPMHLLEQPHSVERTLALFEAENKLLG